jgi:hypothetical protein
MKAGNKSRLFYFLVHNKMIHILNGDALKHYLEYHNFKLEGEIFVFREALIEGPVEKTEKKAEFVAKRADYIHKQYGGKKDDHKKMYAQIFNAVMKEQAEVILWFEYDVFCQLNFWFNVYSLSPILQTNKNVKLSWVSPTSKFPYSFSHHHIEEIHYQFKKRKVLDTENKIVFSKFNICKHSSISKKCK